MSMPTTSRSDRRAHRRRFLPRQERASSRRSPRPGLCAVRRPGLVRNRQAGSGFAKEFAEAIHAKFPGKMLAYNCSPSFNWKKNLDDATIAKFQKELGAMGYKFQFITLAGFHALNYCDVQPGARLCTRQHDGLRRIAGSRIRRRRQGLHRRQAPARSRHRLLRRGDAGDPARPDASTTALHGSTEDEQFFDSKKVA